MAITFLSMTSKSVEDIKLKETLLKNVTNSDNVSRISNMPLVVTTKEGQKVTLLAGLDDEREEISLTVPTIHGEMVFTSDKKYSNLASFDTLINEINTELKSKKILKEEYVIINKVKSSESNDDKSPSDKKDSEIVVKEDSTEIEALTKRVTALEEENKTLKQKIKEIGEDAKKAFEIIKNICTKTTEDK
ncbi:MAG: hypothetical protein ACRC92_27265 [Peptostreptococcaceae bacterium]